MLVAVGSNDIPLARIWLELVKKKDQGVGILFALDVVPRLRGLEVGSWMVSECLGVLKDLGFRTAEIGNYKDEDRTRKFYERMGFGVVGEAQNEWSYINEQGEQIIKREEFFVMQQKL
jgi:ribosomal protein S18 acetylase RimI-like enzyme